MRKLLLAFAFSLLTSGAQAQNVQCATRPPGDNSNACASTAFVGTGFQPLSPNLTALAGLTGAADTGFYFTGVGAMATYSLSSFGRTIAGSANQPSAAATIFPAPTRAGDIAYWNGMAWVTLPGNNANTLVLQEASDGTPSWAPTRSVLTGDLTLYTNGSTGSDSNTGTSIGSPLTLQGAIGRVCTLYDVAGHVITIDTSDGGTFTGTYSAPTLCGYIGYGTGGQGTVIIKGASSFSSSCTNYPTISGNVVAVSTSYPWTFTNIQFVGQIEADAGSFIALDGTCHGASASGAGVIAVNSGSKIEFINHPPTINGAMDGGFAQAQFGGQVLWQSSASPVTITGTPSMGGQFLYGVYGGNFLCQDITFTGAVAASTKHYVLDATSSILCGKTSVTVDPNDVLPGDTVGTGLGTIGQALISGGAGGGTAWTTINYAKVMMGSSGTTALTPGATQYIGLGAIGTTVSQYAVPVPQNYTAKGLAVFTLTAPSAGENYAFTLFSGGSSTSITCTISDTAQTCQDTTHTASVSFGTPVELRVISSGASAGSPVQWSLGTTQ